jgi:acyl-coenzyme A thioesterase PaaI-like protein
MTVTFADLLPLKPISSHSYSIELDKQWCTGAGSTAALPPIYCPQLTSHPVPNGGYTASSFLIAARTRMGTTHAAHNQLDPIHLHVQFLRRTRPGAALFTVKDVKLGSRISTLHLTLSQPKSPSSQPPSPAVAVVEGYISLTSLSLESGLSLPTQHATSSAPPRLPAHLPHLRSIGSDASYTLRGPEPFADFRRAAANVQMYVLRPALRSARPWSVCDLWLRLKLDAGEARWTNDALGFLVDIFPHIIEACVNPEVGPAAVAAAAPKAPRSTFWYPTLTLGVEVKKALPAGGVEFLFVRVRAKGVKRGRFDLEVEVWDEMEELVCLGQHTGLVMDPGRNQRGRL